MYDKTPLVVKLNWPRVKRSRVSFPRDVSKWGASRGRLETRPPLGLRGDLSVQSIGRRAVSASLGFQDRKSVV